MLIESASYDSATQELVLIFKNGNVVRIPISDILTGIATEDWVLLQLQNYVQKESGKGLSTNDYTNADKNKLSGIESGAEKNVQADWNENDSSKDDFIKNKPYIPTKTSDLTNDSGFVDSSYHDSSKQDVINSNNKLNADYVTDLNSTNKFVTAEEKAQIITNKNDITSLQNGKQDKLTDSSSIDLTNNVVSVKDSYVENFFATSEEIDTMLEEVFG